MAKLFTLILSFAFAISCSSANTIFDRGNTEHKAVINGNIRPESVFLIGMVNGKGFFGDRTDMTWQEAKVYCESMNMKLASIKTQDEQDFLKNAWSNGTFEGYFWTSAKDARQLRQFSWEDDTQPSDFYLGRFIFYGAGTITERCLAYYSRFVSSFLVSFPCTDKRFVMCDSG